MLSPYQAALLKFYERSGEESPNPDVMQPVPGRSMRRDIQRGKFAEKPKRSRIQRGISRPPNPLPGGYTSRFDFYVKTGGTF